MIWWFFCDEVTHHSSNFYTNLFKRQFLNNPKFPQNRFKSTGELNLDALNNLTALQNAILNKF